MQQKGAIAGTHQGNTTPHYNQTGHGPLKIQPMKRAETQLGRLQNERDELVQTGCYTDDDPLIQEMDRQIKVLTLKEEAVHYN